MSAEPTVLTTPATVDAALATATHEVLIAGAGWRGPDITLGRVDHDNLRRGVRYRVLVPDSVRGHPAACLRLRCLGGDARIRTVPVVPAGAAVIDATVALFPLTRFSDGVALVELSGVVDAAVALFEGLWDGAVPLAADGDAGGGRERELLALMSAGHTDESAAARLGVSVRTVRRMMSALMARLGARSRFQAGLRAADRGLLTPPG